MKDYQAWNRAVRAYLAFKAYDDVVYKVVGDGPWHSDPISKNYTKAVDVHYDNLIYILSEGREKSYWDWHERFTSPGYKETFPSCPKPVAWDYEGNISHKFYPERLLYALFEQPSRRGYMQALDVYNICKQLEADNETKTASTKVPRRKQKTA
jgi:hypothetical protein